MLDARQCSPLGDQRILCEYICGGIAWTWVSAHDESELFIRFRVNGRKCESINLLELIMVRTKGFARYLCVAVLWGLFPTVVLAGFPGNVVEAVQRALPPPPPLPAIPTPEQVNQSLGDISTAVSEVTTKLNTELKNGVQDTIGTVTTGQPQGDIAKTAVKAGDDIIAQAGRDVENVGDAVDATGNFITNQIESTQQSLSDNEKRLREGKMVDAIWHVALDPVRNAEDNLAIAVSDSSLCNNIATASASIYGGPQGAAAYASWYTYKQTGNLVAALKAGAIAGANAHGLQVANGMPNDDLIKKTLATASIGGAAVAASGGDERAIIEAFVKGAALTAAREHYNKMTQQEIEGRAPTQSAVAKLDPAVQHEFKVLVDGQGNPILDAQGHQQIDITSMPKSISHVGLATADPNAPFLSAVETSPLMQAIAKLPYINDMAYFHDQWMAITQTQGLAVQATILPALVLTVAGSDTPIIQQATQATIENTNEKLN